MGSDLRRLPRKVLVVGMTENPGGIEALLMNVLGRTAQDSIRFDFIANVPEIAFEDCLLGKGCKVYHITMRRESRLRNRIDLERLFRDHASEYDAIWENANSLANIDYLVLAKRYGVPVRIMHGHNSTNSEGCIRGVLHAINRVRVRSVATHFWSVSDEASNWFYGPDYASLPNYRVISNTIDVERFSYNRRSGEAVRKRFGIPDNAILLGNAGRLHEQKNQTLFVKILAELRSRGANAYGLIAGEGALRSELEAEAESLGVSKFFLMPGMVEDASALYSAFDLFLFPSLFEGLSIALLEAQANGVPCLVSDGISDEALLNCNAERCFLSAPPSEWADAAERLLDMGRTRDSKVPGSRFDSRYSGALFAGLFPDRRA